MAEYIRFEIYLPLTFFKTKELPSGRKTRVPTELDTELVAQFLKEACQRYGGATRANPLSAHPYQGYWQPKRKPEPEIDYVTNIIVLVERDKAQDALQFFEQWKKKFEKELEQKIITITYHQLNAFGTLS